MKKINTSKKIIDIIVGTRPNFVKVASLYDELHKNKKIYKNIQFRLIHTGQHYNKNLSSNFFIELKIPEPDYNLAIGSGSHVFQTANIMLAYEKILKNKLPYLCIVVGDVNSTMACAIAVKKFNIKIAHIEAGLRSGDLKMPEEINRIVTDSITDIFFTTSKFANQNLLRNGIRKKDIHFVGNTMIDTLKNNLLNLKKPKIWDVYNLCKKSYIIITLHRPSNVDEVENLSNLLKILSKARNEKFIFPVHPRTKLKLKFIKKIYKNVILTNPLSYLQFNYLLKYSKAVITDSGGITEEATFFNIPCLTLRDTTERPETVILGSNKLIGNNYLDLIKNIKKINSNKWKVSKIPEKWDGNAAKRILKILSQA